VPVLVRPATPDRWNDVVSVFGRRGNDPSWCWCQLFLRSPDAGSETGEPKPDNRNALRREISQAAVAPGLLAYVGDRPVGWTRGGLRHLYRDHGHVRRRRIHRGRTHLPQQTGDAARAVIETSIALGA
jgi:hypothetical protein